MACIHPDTFKYTFDPSSVESVWRELAARYGPVHRNASFRTIEIEAPAFFLRAVEGGNPISVVRKRCCSASDIIVLHSLLGFEEEAATVACEPPSPVTTHSP